MAKSKAKAKANIPNRRVLWMVITAAMAIAGGAFALVYATGDCCAQDMTDASSAPVIQVIGPSQYVNGFSETPHLLVDVRTPEEFFSGHISGSVNIPLQVLNQRMDEIPRDIPVVLYCRSGNRSAEAARLLERAGYSRIYDLGGVIAWRAAGYPLQ